MYFKSLVNRVNIEFIFLFCFFIAFLIIFISSFDYKSFKLNKKYR